MSFKLLTFLMVATLLPAAQNVLVLTTDGQWIEGATSASKAGSLALGKVLSMHNGAAATAKETETITAGLETILGKDRKARDLAVETLTHIGLPVLTPFLAKIRDTDQHEPKPFYNLFDRLMPSIADQPDRTLSLIRMDGSAPTRGAWPQGEITVGGQKLSWSNIRMLAVQRKSITRTMDVHSLRHSTQIEYLDTGLYASAASRWTIAAKGFSRLSWHQDDWATGPNGLTKPAGNYKTNLVDGHPFGALVGRIGPAGAVRFIGASSAQAVNGAGRLHLAINDNAHWQNNLGSYLVTVTLTQAYDLGPAI
jgi:hypothetical protein